MEFDKSRVYTAVNADELKIGSKCLFSDTVKGLRRKVEKEGAANRAETFYRLHNNGADDLFVGNNYAYCYAYLIEPPAESKYKPFKSVEKAMETIKQHGGWVERKNFGTRYILIAKEKHIGLFKQEDGWCTPNDLFQDFVFVDDGSPCGELVEE